MAMIVMLVNGSHPGRRNRRKPSQKQAPVQAKKWVQKSKPVAATPTNVPPIRAANTGQPRQRGRQRTRQVGTSDGVNLQNSFSPLDGGGEDVQHLVFLWQAVLQLRKARKNAREKKKGCFQSESKAYRERLRREKMNDRFSELCKFLHPGRPGHIDKCSILGDAIGSLSKLKSELHELKERKKKIQDSIQNLKAEENELREEKLQLQANKQKIELQIKATSVVPTGLVPMQDVAYQDRGNKGMVMSGYGGYPMWQWIPPAVLDTSQDHVLRPPVA